MSTAKRKPTFTLCIREGERWRSIGAAWETEKGNLFVKMDEGKTLCGTAMLFPYREKPASGFKREEEYRRPAPRAAPPAAPAPPPAAPPSAPAEDYMERQRARRGGQGGPAAPPPPADDACPDPEGPDWL